MNSLMYGMTRTGAIVPIQVDDTGVLTDGESGVATVWTYAAASGGITDQSDVALAAAAGVGYANYLSSLQVQNTHATVATELVVKDGSTVIWRTKLAAAMSNPASIHFGKPLRTSNNTALNVACVTTGTATYVNAQGFVAPTIDMVTANISVQEEIFDDLGVLMTAPDGSTLYLN